MALKFNPITGNLDVVLDKAEEIKYDNGGSGLAATDAQAAIDEVQANLDALPDPIYYAGTWAADTNTPTLANTDVGVEGKLYRVNAAGTVDFGAGNISFEVGDSVVNNGTAWEKWDHSDQVQSVNGQTGAVSLDTDDIGEGSNLYFTDERAQDAAGALATSSAKVSLTYNDAGATLTPDIVAGSLVNADISATAAIAVSKMAAQTANRALATDASGFQTPSATTDTELGYVSGVTSAIQTQLNAKQATITGAATTVVSSDLTADRAMQTDSSGKIAISSVTSTELGYLAGATSTIQNQINLITRPSLITDNDSNFEVSIGSWATYKDAAAVQPVDGTGGVSEITFARTTTGGEVLKGTASAKMSKIAADKQGNGASLDLSVPLMFRGQPVRLAFNYAASANFDYGTAFDSSDPSDVIVQAYDATNGVLLNPYPYSLSAGGRHEAYFQIPASCATLRIILHVATTNANAWDLFVDEFGLELAPNATAKTDSDWESVGSSLTFTGFGTPSSIDIRARKNGPDLEIEGQFTSGTSTATEARISLPWGAVTASDYSTGALVGKANYNSQATTDFSGRTVLIKPSVSYLNFGKETSTNNGVTIENGNGLISNGQIMKFKASIRIQGWTSGNVTAASANLNAPCILRVTGDPASASSGNPIIFPTIQTDNLGIYNASTGRATLKTPGSYLVFGALSSANNSVDVFIYKNGSSYAFLGSTDGSNGEFSFVGMVENANTGDIIDVRPGGTLDAGTTSFNVVKIGESSGRVYATRVAYIKDVKAANTNGGTATSGSFQTRTLNTLEGDSSFVSLASNQFTLQPGTYHITAYVPGFAVGRSVAKLRNTTDSTDPIIGKVMQTSTSDSIVVDSVVAGVFSISSAKTFEIQHRVETTNADDGHGIAANLGVSEVYTVVKLEKVL